MNRQGRDHERDIEHGLVFHQDQHTSLTWGHRRGLNIGSAERPHRSQDEMREQVLPLSEDGDPTGREQVCQPCHHDALKWIARDERDADHPQG
jgi:hypothetical protein